MCDTNPEPHWKTTLQTCGKCHLDGNQMRIKSGRMLVRFQEVSQLATEEVSIFRQMGPAVLLSSLVGRHRYSGSEVCVFLCTRETDYICTFGRLCLLFCVCMCISYENGAVEDAFFFSLELCILCFCWEWCKSAEMQQQLASLRKKKHPLLLQSTVGLFFSVERKQLYLTLQSSCITDNFILRHVITVWPMAWHLLNSFKDCIVGEPLEVWISLKIGLSSSESFIFNAAVLLKNGVYASWACELLPGKHYRTEQDINTSAVCLFVLLGAHVNTSLVNHSRVLIAVVKR